MIILSSLRNESWRRTSISTGANAVPRRRWRSAEKIERPAPSMRNHPAKSRVAQCLDGTGRLTGRLHVPVVLNLHPAKSACNRLDCQDKGVATAEIAI